MKSILISLIILFLILDLYSQEPINFNPVSLESIKLIEDSINSENKGFYYFNPYYDENIEDIYEEWPNVFKEALIYKRFTDDFYPNLHVWYFFDKDSIVKLVYYHWGFPNPKIEASDEQLRNQISRSNEYLTKYGDVKDTLISILGKPNQIEVSLNEPSYISKCTIWDFEDKRIILNMTADKIVLEIDNDMVNRPIILPRSKVQITVLMKE
jgi:hypothetical protein